MSRHEVRDSAFKLLFEQSLRDDNIEELYEIAEEIEEINVNEDVRLLVDGTLAHKDEIDSIIETYSKSRKIARISKLNLSILRLAIFECLYVEKTPMNAAISEAVKLAGTYTYKEDASFINGLLGAFSRDRKGSDE